MIKTYFYGAYRLVLDSSEIFPDDPGQGTPAMVYGPKQKTSATYWCACDTGELSGDPYIDMPDGVMNWLHGMEEVVSAFLKEHGG